MLEHLDRQLLAVRSGTDVPLIPADRWSRVAITIHGEVAGLDETVLKRLRAALLVAPERYAEEMAAFEQWGKVALACSANPFVVRARVMTELYVAFVWLKDSLLRPTAKAVSDQSTLATVERFLSSGRRRMLRNAVAHGRWCYLPDFKGLEGWAEPSYGQPHECFEISQRATLRRDEGCPVRHPQGIPAETSAPSARLRGRLPLSSRRPLGAGLSRSTYRAGSPVGSSASRRRSGSSRRWEQP